MKRTARLVYVASPYAGLRCGEASKHVVAVKLARDECRKVVRAGYTPISPVLAWHEMLDEKKDRETALNAGIELMSACSYIYFSKHPDSAFSNGMKMEREYAREIGLTELDFDSNTPEPSPQLY